jgi:peptidoglycan/xylan/chitin deacetylase (PgdA/CDA1 family)
MNFSKTFLKPYVIFASHTSGLNALSRRLKKNNLLVLCYHAVIPGDEKARMYQYTNTVSVAEFDRQLNMIQRYYQVITPEDLIFHITGKKELPQRAALITFDDGYRNNYLYAVPVLKKYELSAIFFIPTGFVGNEKILWPQKIELIAKDWSDDFFPLPGSLQSVKLPESIGGRQAISEHIVQKCKQISYEDLEAYLLEISVNFDKQSREVNPDIYDFMNWDEVRKLKLMGFSIGSHSVNHPILSRVNREQLRREIRVSKTKIEKELGSECILIAYPNGRSSDLTKETFREAKKAGYKIGFTISERFNPKNLFPYEIGRMSIESQAKLDFLARISGFYDFFR